jgi:iron only hydrogenase large subunit-like protein
MPCYDKKLEASRKDFYDDVYSTRDVDCVITTGELELMMREKGWDLSLPVPGELDPFPTSLSNPATVAPPLPIPIPELLIHPGTSSGSYLHAIISHLQATSPVPLTLSIKTLRNADYEEYTLRKTVSTNGLHVNGTNGISEVKQTPSQFGEIVFKGAKCYGFRNLQNVVRKVGRERGVQTASGAAGKLGAVSRPRGGVRRLRRGGAGGNAEKEQEEERGYDYVEVMACPGGCVNGGGQLKPVLSGTGAGVDEEGYKRDWEGSGVAPGGGGGGGGEANVLQNARWGDREWTRQVEEVYWRDRHGALSTSDCLDADVLMNRVCDDLVHRVGVEEMEVDGVTGEEREEKRRRFFRTQYRAVESEVVGLAVVW